MAFIDSSSQVQINKGEILQEETETTEGFVTDLRFLCFLLLGVFRYLGVS